MSYNYKDKIIDNEISSYQEKFLDYAQNWEDDIDHEKKRVKIINYNNGSSSLSLTREEISFEDKINAYIEENARKIKIIDIKYQKNSVLIIYENKN